MILSPVSDERSIEQTMTKPLQYPEKSFWIRVASILGIDAIRRSVCRQLKEQTWEDFRRAWDGTAFNLNEVIGLCEIIKVGMELPNAFFFQMIRLLFYLCRGDLGLTMLRRF